MDRFYLRRVVFLLAVLLVAIFAGGAWHYTSQARSAREQVSSVLRVIAELGLAGLVIGTGAAAWRWERRAHAAALDASEASHRESRSRADLALEASERRYRRIFESAPIGLLILDQGSGEVLDANPHLLQLIDRARAQVIGRRFWDLAEFRSVADSEDEFRRILEGGEAIIVSASLERHDGRSLDVDLELHAFPVENGQAIQCIVRDRTDEERQATWRGRLMAAIEQSGEVVLITDTDGAIRYVNPVFTAVTGYAREEALGRNPRFLKSGHHDAAFYRDLWTTVAAGKAWKGRLINKRKDGSIFTEEATISPVFDDAGRIVNYVAVKRDITHQLNTEAQLLQAQKLESIARLAGGVAHDFNNLLSVILGRAELALRRGPASDPGREDLEEILSAATRSVDVTRQLLAFARRQAIVPQVLDLNATVESMLGMLRHLIGEDIDLSWAPQAGLWPVKMDSSQIDQILANLCVNARDAIGDVGRIAIETANVTLDADDCIGREGFVPGAYVRLAVSDSGSGMDQETMARIFEPFFTTKEAGKGTGLGLATVYGIVRQNEGAIDVHSEPGRGSTFTIYLPRAAGPVEVRQADTMGTPPAGRGETILVVEDEPAILRMATTMLQRLGYRVLGAGSPSEALEAAWAHEGDIHLLISDVVMPQMNGRDLATRLQIDRPDLKCVFMSGYAGDIIVHRGVLDEGTHFIQKPFTLPALAAAVRAALDV